MSDARLRLLDVTRWPALLLFIVMAASGGALAFVSFDLLRMALANRDLIVEHGLMGLMDGGAAQAVWIAAQGLLALALFLVFKLAEVEIVARLRRPRG